MKKMIFELLLAVPMFSAASASALPGFPAPQPLLRDVIEVRGGHGGTDTVTAGGEDIAIARLAGAAAEKSDGAATIVRPASGSRADVDCKV
jgi:hypothetical protein